MTGLERLREKQASNEVEKMKCAADEVSMSAYDLLPEEDREAIAWLRKHGGVAEVEMRLVPEGMEWLVEAWPRFEDDAPVRFGEEAMGFSHLPPFVVDHVTLFDGGEATVCAEADLDSGKVENFVRVFPGECIKRPSKVLDADGAEIRVGDTVWDTEFGCEFVVTKVAGDTVFVAFEDVEADRRDPAGLTHRAPVLAADGKPLREGETVWHVKTGREYVVVEPSYGKSVVVRLAKYNDAEGEQYAPDLLTHERPDSWERLAEDIGAMVVAWRSNKDLFDAQEAAAGCVGENTLGAALDSLALRARALAERGQ